MKLELKKQVKKILKLNEASEFDFKIFSSNKKMLSKFFQATKIDSEIF